MFRRSLAQRRCVLPTTGFFEWGPGEDGAKRKYRFNLPETRALYLAGFWNDFSGEKNCVVLTTAANASVEDIHDRMPVVLLREQLEPWVRDAAFASELMGRVPPPLEKCEA